MAKSKLEKLRENTDKKRREAECVEVVIEKTGLPLTLLGMMLMHGNVYSINMGLCHLCG